MATVEGMVRMLVREWFHDLEDFAIADVEKRFTEDDYAVFELWAYLEGKDFRLRALDRAGHLPKLRVWFADEANKLHVLRHGWDDDLSDDGMSAIA
ncbi:hypothetical protein SAMN05421853_12211 [Roseivivax halotolerans]|uniref:Uncharacterized protein n=1 Tax=Roseivivax halotolerans TaxID=93684 RepID=A0A1I6AJI8_9RHOB|nr:hypothetical protein [Roseivivax halotolerans]SFQ68864.1 hypothetical protein SAMN05421853_12211 [Roseivivax halotolerans]